ncbi:MAG: DUF3108 domain-containing protein [gamma proteobacterium symbiont of Bathyaustriella thionipta]|nr:DUF3108 domain-containing protein [gamma proteobacterium symbiont of Bathyaustriella thionipta]MCU7949098.1 DUF3108 domain-containing protein [gamma proteobacterium symbiont of Bathyaustriella thionipta]MCU7952794.1 DUF3108 domain-containing protein [gamma proteobacterium symbiont of Bathyaustriella thionipta]MCU7955685.1 DUF3108 domain-containing protein [gamma proteobacterium symbiont of Bathyaustriella thionipta]MCU7967999.1 DUF3108 domain-containing protein [gamma proteobacterium symbion
MQLQRSCLIIFLVSCLSITHATADTKVQLKPFVATYLVTAMGLEGINVTNSLSLHQSNDHHQKYHFKSYSMPVGLLAFKKDETRDEQSEGQIIDHLIRPEHYSFVQLRNGKTHRDVELSFNWQRKEVTNHHKHKNSKWKLPVSLDTVDKLSYQLALMLKLAQAPDKTFSFPIADGGKLKKYNFEILGEERVYTSLGSYKAIKIQHQRYKKGKNITLWCAAKLNYLPVKIIQEETGKPTFISTLVSYQEGMSNQSN